MRDKGPRVLSPEEREERRAEKMSRDAEQHEHAMRNAYSEEMRSIDAEIQTLHQRLDLLVELESKAENPEEGAILSKVAARIRAEIDHALAEKNQERDAAKLRAKQQIEGRADLTNPPSDRR